MSADFNKPLATSTKLGFLTEIKDMFASLVKMDGAGANLPAGAVRHNDSVDRLEKWSGSSWASILNAQMPVGSMVQTVLAAAPAGWALCQGQTVSQTGTYAGLWAAMGSAHLFGSDPGGGNFLLPDLRSRVPVGLNSGDSDFNAVGKTGGSKTHTLGIAEIPAHNHEAGPGTGATGTESVTHTHNISDTIESVCSNAGVKGLAATSPGSDWGVTSTASVTLNANANHVHGLATNGNGSAHQNMQPYLVMNYIVKL